MDGQTPEVGRRSEAFEAYGGSAGLLAMCTTLATSAARAKTVS